MVRRCGSLENFTFSDAVREASGCAQLIPLYNAILILYGSTLFGYLWYKAMNKMLDLLFMSIFLLLEHSEVRFCSLQKTWYRVRLT